MVSAKPHGTFFVSVNRDRANGSAEAFPEIAGRENQGERHTRLLAPLAFVSPRIIVSIAGGTAPADLTVTVLAKALSYS
jgi:site-specific DNA recombinase